MNKILQKIADIDLGSNETYVHATINRNIERLLSNDLQLDEFSFNNISSTVLPYDSNHLYSKGDIVWYHLEDDPRKLFILKSLTDSNFHVPEYEIIDGTISFDKSGWYDMNPYSTLVDNNLTSNILAYAASRMNIEHNFDDICHKFGKLSSGDELSSKLLLDDMSNIDADRKHIKFPYQTVQLSSDNVIRGGFYRQWDNGLIEYSIIFRLGYTGNKQYLNGIEYDVVECNNLVLEDGDQALATDDIDIFNYDGEDGSMMINSTLETNHGKYVDSYSGEIAFPVPFIDTNYMVFSSDIIRQEQDVNTRTLDIGQNALSFANKTLNSICPVFIMYPSGANVGPYEHGLVENNFHCQIVGRWK